MADHVYNLGTQPIDDIMSTSGLSNRALVDASAEMLTFKVVQKARKGRRLTRRAQEKVLRALNKSSGERTYKREELFNYEGT